MNRDSREHDAGLPRTDTAMRANAEGRPIAIQAALDAFEDGDKDAYEHFLCADATPEEVRKHLAAFARATASTEPVFFRMYERARADYVATKTARVSPISPPLTGCGENGERVSGILPNQPKSSFGESGETGDSGSTSPITLTPFCDLDAPPLPPEAYLFRDIIVRGAVTIVVGAPGSGKSTFAYFIAARLARDGSVLGSGPGQPIPVAYFDAESSPSLAREKAMLASEDQVTRRLLKLSDNAFGGDDTKLIALLRAHGIQLLIIDTLTRALPVESDIDSSEARQRVTRLRRIARETDLAVLAIGHQPKVRHAASVHNVLGSIETAAGVDVIVLAKSSGSKGRLFGLEIAKSRIASTPTDDLRLYKTGNGAFDLAESIATRAPTKEDTLIGELERFAREQGKITRQDALAIASKCEASENTAQRALDQLVDSGILQKTARAVYEITDASASDMRQPASRAEREGDE